MVQTSSTLYSAIREKFSGYHKYIFQMIVNFVSIVYRILKNITILIWQARTKKKKNPAQLKFNIEIYVYNDLLNPPSQKLSENYG